MTSEIDMRMAEVAQSCTVTVHVSGVRSFAFRIWLGSQLFRLGTWVMGMKVVFDISEGR